jgi:acyl carrier protein
MDRSNILQIIRDNLAIVVDDPSLQISEATTSEDVEEWDSVNHMKLIIALEDELHIRFEPDEITALSDVKGLVDLIEQKL